MTTPAWLIPALRAALRVAVRLLRRYDAVHPTPAVSPFDPNHYLYGSLVFSKIELDNAASFPALLDAKLETLRLSMAMAYEQRTRAVRRLTELDIPR